jgi:hypothetical protein
MKVSSYAAYQGAEPMLVVKIERLEADNKALQDTLGDVLAHLEELAEAWRRGALLDHDGKGGTRSNRNYELMLHLKARHVERNREAEPQEKGENMLDPSGPRCHDGSSPSANADTEGEDGEGSDGAPAQWGGGGV